MQQKYIETLERRLRLLDREVKEQGDSPNEGLVLERDALAWALSVIG